MKFSNAPIGTANFSITKNDLRERPFDFYGGGAGRGDFFGKKIVRTGLCKK